MGQYSKFISIICTSLFLLDLSIAADTLFQNQTLSNGRTLISPSQVFELGFFSPGTSKSKYFLGIWYTNTPDIVVWVANRNNPILGSQGVLSLGSNGVLSLSTGGDVAVWSSNPARAPSSPVLKLLDTGNLMVVNETGGLLFFWQSFDFPTDTRLPGMKMVYSSDSMLERYFTSWKSPDDPSDGNFTYRIENQGLPQITISVSGRTKKYRSGPWNGRFFSGLPFLNSSSVTTRAVFDEDGLISISESYNSSISTRLVMNSSGFAQRYVMNDRGDGWELVFVTPKETCENYAFCGPNGICRRTTIPLCDCLKGFKPKSQRQWDMLDWSGGCSRSVPSDCVKENGFLKLDGIKLPDPLNFRLNASMGFDACHDECLKNCGCTAYANRYSNSSVGCLMWFGDLIDIRELPEEASFLPSVYIRVAASELETNNSIFPEEDWNKKRKKRTLTIVVIITATSGVGILLMGLLFGIMIRRMKLKRRDLKENSEDQIELPLFSLETIASATNNFSGGNVIGKGGFGPVYKGSLSSGQLIAVKRMSRTSGQGPEEFRNEVILIAKLQHRNLVRILGCCIRGEERMLIYEYMENKSLDYFIFGDQHRRALLTWPKRFDIVMDIARGLLYLHQDSRLKIIHRDMKTSNILLDGNFNAKISDFGLARIFEGNQTTARTKRVVGT